MVMSACLVLLGSSLTLATTAHAEEAIKPIKLNKEEQAFLKAHPVIRLGASESWAPYVVKGADGVLKGFDVDTLRYINETTGANIQLVAGKWPDIVQKAKAGEIDGLAHSVPLKKRAHYFNFSDVYFLIVSPYCL